MLTTIDRMLAEEDLVEAEAAVAQGKRHIKRQIAIISELERDGHDAARAVDLLRTFREVQVEHEAHRDRIRAELGAPMPMGPLNVAR